MFLVTEALGATGAAAIEWLTSRKLAVRAACLEPSRMRRTKLIEPVRFDWNEPEHWDSALDGIEGVVFVLPSDVAGLSDRFCDFADAMVDTGCRRVSFLSVAEAETDRWIPHRRIERVLRQSNMSWTFLRAGVTSQSLVDCRRSTIGALELVAPAGAGSVAWVDARDLGEAAARTVVDEIWDQRTPLLTGPEALGFGEVRRIVSEEIGVEIRCRGSSLAGDLLRLRLRQGMSWGRCLERVRRSRRVCGGRAAAVSDDLRVLLGRAPRRISDFVRDHRGYFEPNIESPATLEIGLATKIAKSKRRSAACEV